ncbi:hypothetical protein [Halobacterium zhouii]|uniref:hypothetical protein n=1 Tax=Halobacterium zhouii TaxID=2902624 RepID=UPI001E435FEC|nr:hypothetical protein [Halobacterium zhouii]
MTPLPLHAGTTGSALPLAGLLVLGTLTVAVAVWLSARFELSRATDALEDRRSTVLVSALAVAMALKIALVGVGFFVTGYVTPAILLLGVVGGAVIWGVVVPQM